MAYYNYKRTAYINCGDVPAHQALSLFSSDKDYEAAIVRIMRSPTCTMTQRRVHQLSEFRVEHGRLVARTNQPGGVTVKLGEIMEVTRRPVLESI